MQWVKSLFKNIPMLVTFSGGNPEEQVSGFCCQSSLTVLHLMTLQIWEI